MKNFYSRFQNSNSRHQILDSSFCCRGQSLLELLLSIAVGTIMIGGSVLLMSTSLRSYQSVKQKLTVNSLLRQEAEIIISLSQDNWHTIADLTPNSNYYATSTNNLWSVATGQEEGIINNVSYRRYFKIFSVYRNNSGEIAESGNIDPNTLKINSIIEYGPNYNSSSSLVFYLTRSANNKVIQQTDWSGGGGVLGPFPNFGNTYYSSSGILDDYNNQLINSGFDSIESGYSPGWDVNLNGTYRPASNTPWSTGYNSGVSSPSVGYHAHINPNCGIGNTPCFEYIDENCQYGYCHRWLGVAYPLGTPASRGWTAGKKITVKLYGKVNSLSKPVTFGLYYYNTAGQAGFYSGRPELYFSSVNIWELKEYTFTLSNDVDTTKNISLYIYGHFGGEGRLWVDNVVLQNGPQLILASGYSSGELISSIVDTGIEGGAGFNSVLWQGNKNNGSVKIMISTSNSQDGPWSYYGCTTAPSSCLDSNNWTTSSSSVAALDPNISLPLPFSGDASPQNKRYIRYKVFLSTSGTSPQINDIIINWNP